MPMYTAVAATDDDYGAMLLFSIAEKETNFLTLPQSNSSGGYNIGKYHFFVELFALITTNKVNHLHVNKSARFYS